MKFRIGDKAWLKTEEQRGSNKTVSAVIIGGKAYGPADVIDGRLRASDFVVNWAVLPGRTEAEIGAARAFLTLWPKGPQIFDPREVVG